MTPEEIALNFSERFQKNYPKEPLWEMMDDLSNEIKYYASSMCKRQREELDNQRWISVKDRLPEYKRNADGSEADSSDKVFTKDKSGNLYVMELWYERDAGGWLWANCYGDINGDAEIDDDYADIITHWMPLPLATEEVKNG